MACSSYICPPFFKNIDFVETENKSYSEAKVYRLKSDKKYNFKIDFELEQLQANTHLITEFWKLFTLLIDPAKRDFTFKVTVRLYDENNNLLQTLSYIESYTYEISTIPYSGSTYDLRWHKEPILNVFKIALNEFKEKGYLKP